MQALGRAARGACWLLAAASACAWAAIEGGTRHAWTGSVNGPALHGRGQRAVSPPILPTGVLPQSEGVITSVRWRYSFAKTPPLELQAYLCNAQRCVLLPQAEGKTDAFFGDDATKGFVFAFRVPGQGSLVPVLQGRSNEVVVGFR
ncbi:Flagellar biosynthesis protein [Cupriavidus necator]|uniref:Flagellar biosynthesis protein n=1 Tax=Cupriavidus necator (strain ATCC 17699 / DSM 428 / KCTC 22496 / NCIMB 10442 / H16 / Stanier 337) TaxID=381666 RepID=Q0K4L6_CUPNH|nr:MULTISPECIES: flagellar protein FlhE [Cupriavidus]EON18282.1 flagellar biosynthesis protein [Cupriavidus sp. GA3-3]KUE86346.1 flagellar biosynthesis protein FlhE [Cupriavidus necator]QCC02992.1 flagellar protein FlhE [Cupriavidus necator H16]QQB80049.1 flagellar protein FlhE [Cupriavidus necator]WKA44304.1 flagellar protein FlhE [Cupriavidus necator]